MKSLPRLTFSLQKSDWDFNRPAGCSAWVSSVLFHDRQYDRALKLQQWLMFHWSLLQQDNCTQNKTTMWVGYGLMVRGKWQGCVWVLCSSCAESDREAKCEELSSPAGSIVMAFTSRCSELHGVLTSCLREEHTIYTAGGWRAGLQWGIACD